MPEMNRPKYGNKPASSGNSDVVMLRRDALVMANARRLIKAKSITSNGRLYMELFGTGMQTARDRVRGLGLDPDSNATIYNVMMEHLAT